MPGIGGVLETALYVEDLERSVQFYRSIFQWETLESDDRFCAFNVSGRNVFLLFQKGGTVRPVALPGGVIPPHDGDGKLHTAFSIATSDLKDWEDWLSKKGVTVESKVTWPGGGQSLYFRDPDGHLLELATPGTWSIY